LLWFDLTLKKIKIQLIIIYIKINIWNKMNDKTLGKKFTASTIKIRGYLTRSRGWHRPLLLTRQLLCANDDGPGPVVQLLGQRGESCFGSWRITPAGMWVLHCHIEPHLHVWTRWPRKPRHVDSVLLNLSILEPKNSSYQGWIEHTHGSSPVLINVNIGYTFSKNCNLHVI
jgi:hypothetical protein